LKASYSGSKDPISVESTQSDEERLSALGYSQDLERGWTRIQNFAIISVLAAESLASEIGEPPRFPEAP